MHLGQCGIVLPGCKVRQGVQFDKAGILLWDDSCSGVFGRKTTAAQALSLTVRTGTDVARVPAEAAAVVGALFCNCRGNLGCWQCSAHPARGRLRWSGLALFSPLL